MITLDRAALFQLVIDDDPDWKTQVNEVWDCLLYDDKFRISILSGSRGGSSSGGYAAADITVVDGMATVTVEAVDYTWPVEEGGDGAPPGLLGYDTSFALYTYLGTNYRWPVVVPGTGGAFITVTDGIATVTVGTTNIDWVVEEI